MAPKESCKSSYSPSGAKEETGKGRILELAVKGNNNRVEGLSIKAMDNTAQDEHSTELSSTTSALCMWSERRVNWYIIQYTFK